MISFTVAGQPVSFNQAWKTNGYGRIYKSHVAVGYQNEVAHHAASARRGQTLLAAEVRIRFYFKTNASDLDGPVKLVLDGLEVGRVYSNDKHVRRLYVEKHIDRESPRTEVEIERVEEV